MQQLRETVLWLQSLGYCLSGESEAELRQAALSALLDYMARQAAANAPG